MDAHDLELGPVDIVVIGYPADAPMTGEAVPILLDLVDRKIIRVLDVMFVVKEADGTFSGFEASGLDERVWATSGSSRSLVRPSGRGRRRHRGRRDRARHRCGDDRLRESLGGAVRRRRATQRRGAAGQPAHPGSGPLGCARLRREHRLIEGTN